MVQAVKVMAAIAKALVENRELLKKVNSKHQGKLASDPYQCLIPDDMNPPVANDWFV